MPTTKEFSTWYLTNEGWTEAGIVQAKTFREAKEMVKRKHPRAKDYDVVLLKEFLK